MRSVTPLQTSPPRRAQHTGPAHQFPHRDAQRAHSLYTRPPLQPPSRTRYRDSLEWPRPETPSALPVGPQPSPCPDDSWAHP